MRSKVTEREWHAWRGISIDRADLFRGRVTLGWLTIYVWWFDGSLRQHLADVEGKLRAAIKAARGE